MGDGSQRTGGEAQSASLSGRAGYLPPEEQARRQAQDEQYDRWMNSTGAQVYEQRQQEDAAVNASASGGGYVMDVETMRSLLPRWQSVADKLKEAIKLGKQLKYVKRPAEDEASVMQKKAADAHADAYVTSVTAQHEYAQAYVQAFQDAITAYEQREHVATEALHLQGRQV